MEAIALEEQRARWGTDPYWDQNHLEFGPFEKKKRV
jgi:hypothetical protein